MSYASNTNVSVDKSMSQVRQMLTRNKSQGVAIAETEEGAATQFIFDNKPYKFVIRYPSKTEERIAFTNSGRPRTESKIDIEIESEKRRLWRCMVLYIKAAIEAHNNGLVDFKRSMVGYMLLPSGKTFYQEIESNIPRLEANPKFMLEC